MAATMSSDMDKTDKVVTFIEECRAMGLTLLPPDVNRGEYQFTVDEDNNIIYGLGAIKGLGEGPVAGIIEGRQSGAFSDIFDFCSKVDPQKINKRALEALVRSGAFDEIGPQIQNAGIVDLFGDVMPSSDDPSDVYQDFVNTHRWSMKERLNGEKDTLGLYLTGHPIDEYEQEIQYLVSQRIVNLTPERKSKKIAGLVVAMRVMKTKKGDTMGFITLDDRTGRIEVAVFADTYNNYRDKMIKDALLIVEGQVSHDDYSGGLKMRANKIIALEEARHNSLSSICIHWRSQQLALDNQQKLAKILEPYRILPESEKRGCDLLVNYQRADSSAKIRLPNEWRVQPADELMVLLRESYGSENLVLEY